MPFHKIKSFLFNFFHFNKQERNGVFVLCCIIATLFLIKLLIPYLNHNSSVQLITINPSVNPDVQAAIDNTTYASEANNEIETSSEKFVFNPNTVTKEDAKKLGFSEKLGERLVKFRSKGGKFFKAEDLKKLYGISPKLYQELENYILIPNTRPEFKKDSVFVNTPKTYEKKVYSKTLVEINVADSLSLVFLKGIGPGFTKRIIKYRTMLGGFHSILQLKEVYGMTDSLFVSLSSQIKVDANAIIKIPINAIDFNSLRKHPYFNFQSAQAIVNYRTKHGKLTEADFKNLGMFNDEKMRLILPYLSY